MRKQLILLLLLPSILFSQENIKFSETIIIEDLQRHLNILASDSLEGRETGKPGQKMAADYIMNHFKDIGIPPYKKNTYYQKFKVKSGRHLCKCDDCDVSLVKKIFKNKKKIKGENVLGYIEGSDLKEELIIITATTVSGGEAYYLVLLLSLGEISFLAFKNRLSFFSNSTAPT